MLCKAIIEKIEAVYPKQAALEWDNVGLLVGRTEKEVRRIYVALDATDEVIDEAVRKNADMLITHHPMIFSPLKKITDEHFIGNRVVKLLQHDISYYAMHTNYDVLGMAALAEQKLGLVNAEALEVINQETLDGIGRVGEFSRTMTVEECCEFVKEVFQLSTVKVFGEKSKKIRRVAVCPGSGKSVIEIAIQKNAEILITGDIGHHEGIDAVERGLVIVDAGHYGVEHIFIADMAEFLRKHVKDVIVEQADIMHPFQII